MAYDSEGSRQKRGTDIEIVVTRRHIMECRLKWKKPFNQHIRIFDPQQDHLQFNAKMVVKFSFGYTSKKQISVCELPGLNKHIGGKSFEIFGSNKCIGEK